MVSEPPFEAILHIRNNSTSPLPPMSFSLSRDANARSELDCIKLHITIDGDTCPVFEIPRVDFKNFTTFPLKWLRFLGFTIYGAEGHISLAVDGESENDSVGVDVVHLLSNTYYYVSQGAPPKLFDVIDAMYCHSSNSSAPSLRATSFREKILQRDDRCIMTTQAEGCHAYHIIPHSKGDDFIKMLTTTYAASATDTEIVDDINDVRNGFLLHESIHPLLDHSDVAILKTPNFALQPNEVPGFSNQEERFTFQWFPERNRVERPFNQQMQNMYNVDASFPSNTIDFEKPSVILLNVMYAASALQAWGMVDFARFIGGALHDAPEGRTTRSAQSKTNLSPNMHMLGATASPSFSTTNTDSHTGRATSGRTSGSRNDLLDLVYEIRRKVLGVGDIEVNAEEIAKCRSTEKVMEWFGRAPD
ncbi:hypothetical protein SCHPADRAFT_999898 [Schizopora paradoxa]|uniref:HNH nuclease domain-containing protein n=1 Tax=Schizopora paradoxa TaxID=27342 RepID=A0A0H2RDV1_9AGAM|nr:hypothetical protein SCHPADRAFT_999898 [Schizopora paradoxa]